MKIIYRIILGVIFMVWFLAFSYYCPFSNNMFIKILVTLGTVIGFCLLIFGLSWLLIHSFPIE